MKVYSIVVGVLSGFILSGCMASSAKEMTLDTKVKKKQVIVAQNYQELYKRALEKSRECHEGGLLTAAIIADGQIYPDLKEAEISIYLMGGLGRQMQHTAKFKAIDNNTTDLMLYSYFHDQYNDILQREFTGECISCGCNDEDKKNKLALEGKK